MLTDFFRLDGAPRDIHEDELIAHLRSQNLLTDAIYRDRTLSDLREAVFRGKTLRNVSFSKARIARITFTECTFEDCLFIGTIFEDCEFHRCIFINCNLYKGRFVDVYIDPNAFRFEREYKRTHANVILGLYQRLEGNLRNIAQKGYAAEAEILFQRWRRYQLLYALHRHWISRSTYIVESTKNWLFDTMAGYGNRPGRFILFTVIVLLAFAMINYVLWPLFECPPPNDKRVSFVTAVYYTFILMTMVGFGDIFTTSPLGHLVSLTEALFGVALLGLFTAVIVKNVFR